jgi:CRISPR-associated protein Cmr5
MPRTREQRYADIAYRCIQEVAAQIFEDYKTRADSFPTFVMQAGLAQAVGFLKAKGDVYTRYLNDLSHVLGKSDAKDFYKEVIAAELSEYRLLTRQALAAAGWLKRMAQARKAEQHQSGGAGS